MSKNQNSKKRSKGRDARKGFLYQDIYVVHLLLDMLDSEKGRLIKKIVVEGVKKKVEDIRVVFCDETIEYYQVKTKDPPRNWSKSEVMDVIQKFLSEKTTDNERFIFISDNNPAVHCKQLCDTIEKVRNSQEFSEDDRQIIQEMKSLLGTTYQETIETLHKINVDMGKGNLESLYENTCHKAGMILGIKYRKEIDRLIKCILAEVCIKSSEEAPWKRVFKRDDIKKVIDHCSQASQKTSRTAFEVERPGEDVIVRVVHQSSDQLNAPFLAPPPSPYELIGRDDMLHGLKQRLFANCDVALYGLPGVGKTALAVELAHDSEVQQYFQDGVLWAGLGRDADVLSHLSTWGTYLGIHSEEMASLTSIEERVKVIRAAIGMRRMLLVIDDAWEADEALALKLGCPNCVHMVTTRIPEVALRFADKETHVHELNEAEGLRLLKRLAQDVVEAEPEKAQELVQAVGGLPLALIIMGSYLKVKTHGGQPRRLHSELDLLCQTKERLRLEMPRWPPDYFPSISEKFLSLMAVISISNMALDEVSRQALGALSVFPPKPNTFSEEVALAVSSKTVETLDTLIGYGLLESSGKNRYMLHQTITDYARSKLIDKTAYDRIAEFFVIYVENHKNDHSALDLETTNILAALQAAFDRRMYDILVRGANIFFNFLDTRGLYETAKIHLTRAQEASRTLSNTAGLVTTLQNLGIVALNRGDYARAEEYLQEGLTVAREIRYHEGISALLTILGNVTSKQGDYARAEEYLQEGLTIAREIRHRERISNLFIYLGNLASNRGNYSHAEKYYLEALAIASEIKHRGMICEVLANLGLVTSKQVNNVQAEKYYLEALAIACEIKHRRTISYCLKGLGFIAEQRGDYARAEEYLQEGLAIAREIGHRERIISLLLGLGQMSDDRGDYKQAEEYLQEGLTVAREIRNRDYVSVALLDLGLLAINRGDYKQAEEYLQEGLTIAREIGHRERISGHLDNLGNVAINRGDYKQAEEYLQEGLAIAREIGHRECISGNLDDLGLLAMNLGDYARAEEYLQEGLTVAREIRNQKGISIVLADLGLLAINRGDYKQAEEYLQEGLTIAREIRNYWNISNILNVWGELYIKRQELKLANAAFLDALEIAQKIGGQELIATALYGLARIFAIENNSIEARSHGRESLRIFETIGHKKAVEVKQWLKKLPLMS